MKTLLAALLALLLIGSALAPRAAEARHGGAIAAGVAAGFLTSVFLHAATHPVYAYPAQTVVVAPPVYPPVYVPVYQPTYTYPGYYYAPGYYAPTYAPAIYGGYYYYYAYPR